MSARSLTTRLAVVIGAALCLIAATSSAAMAADRPKLLVRYATVANCTVFLNYPKAGVVANSTFVVPAGKEIVWRYNVNSEWAAVSDPARANVTFPWWGFTRRGCIGRSVKQSGFPAGQPVPSRILQGRSAVTQSGWRAVDFSVAPAAITAHHRRVNGNATLRDGANFVIGNVPDGWHVDVTGRTRSNGGWVEVYVPNAKRWGYIQSGHVR